MILVRMFGVTNNHTRSMFAKSPKQKSGHICMVTADDHFNLPQGLVWEGVVESKA